MPTMEETDHILSYLKTEYAPLSIIVYGSYADGSQNEHSDFDALVISESHKVFHDVSFVAGIPLDVYIYPRQYFEEGIHYEDFVQIPDGNVVMDTDGIGLSLKRHVTDYRNSLPAKSLEELQNDVAWCRKMVLRAERNDAEGLFRWHWALIDSLEIFCSIMHYPYRGPKKSLRWMKENHPVDFSCYLDAMSSLDMAALRKWLNCLETHLEESSCARLADSTCNTDPRHGGHHMDIQNAAFTIRHSTMDDLPRMLEIYACARKFMAENGNPNQWGPTHWPPETLLKGDIAASHSYICEADGRIVGTFFYDYGPHIESTYETIVNGQWIGPQRLDESGNTYGVVHRLAGDGSVSGIGTCCLNWALKQCHHLRIDTHFDNHVMQNLLAKLGFTRCGVIYVEEDNDPRIAYEILQA